MECARRCSMYKKTSVWAGMWIAIIIISTRCALQFQISERTCLASWKMRRCSALHQKVLYRKCNRWSFTSFWGWLALPRARDRAFPIGCYSTTYVPCTVAPTTGDGRLQKPRWNQAFWIRLRAISQKTVAVFLRYAVQYRISVLRTGTCLVASSPLLSRELAVLPPLATTYDRTLKLNQRSARGF